MMQVVILLMYPILGLCVYLYVLPPLKRFICFIFRVFISMLFAEDVEDWIYKYEKLSTDSNDSNNLGDGGE